MATAYQKEQLFMLTFGHQSQSDWKFLFALFTPLTRKDRKRIDENARGRSIQVAIRSIRRDAIENIKSWKKTGLSED